MLQNKKIAFFIDVDNLVIESQHYANLIEQLNGMGKILYGKIYGAGERKHKEIYADAAAHNYDTDRPMRVKRRGKRDFDNRIFVDVVDAVAKAPTLDAVCIAAQPTDMVYLFSYLRRRGISVISLDNVDDTSREFIDEFVELGKVQEIKLPKSKPSKEPAKKAEPAPAPKAEPAPAPKAEPEKKPAVKNDVDRTEELLREIERLRALATEEPARKPAPVHEEPVEQPAPEPVKEEPAAEPVVEEPAPAPAKEDHAKHAAKPRAQYTAQNDSDLIRRIEELRRNNEGGDPDDLIDEIRKLLDLE